MKTLKILSQVFLLVFVISCGTDKKEKNTEETEIEVTSDGELTGDFVVDNKNSVIKWVGSKPGGSHNGTIKIENGEMSFEKGDIVMGNFTMDMTSIEVDDLESGDGKEDLESHLKGTVEGKEDHFFNVTKFPKSSFQITKVDRTDGKYILNGELTIKGVTKPVEVISMLSVGANEEEIKLTSMPFKIDRTQWGIEYMSKSIFDDLKDKFIDDEIELEVMVKAKKQA